MHQEEIIALFNATARDYEANIVPAFTVFAEAVIHTAQPAGHEHALDVGTGTGILARLLAPHVASVTGIDIAPKMIEEAQAFSQNIPNLRFQIADVHALPFDDETFDLIVSSFGLNATTPSVALPQIHRILQPGGVLAFHEWNLQHRLDSLLIDVMVKYMLDDDEADADLLAFRHYLASPRPWDNLFQFPEEYIEELSAYGFHRVQAWEEAPAECIMEVNDFLAYKLAWANRRAELEAMDPWRRGDCIDALRDQFQDEVESDGLLHYAPTLFCIRAIK